VTFSLVELRYASPSESPKEIVIRTYSDGGVTVVIPPKKVNPMGVLVGLLLIECVFLMPVLFFAIKHGAWSVLGVFLLVSIIAPGLFLMAILFPRKVDPIEIIAISPTAVYIKPGNSKPYSLPRSDLKSIKTREASYGINFIPKRIILSFQQNGWRSVCEGRTELETRAVADAIQKAMDATASPTDSTSS
jgi:hypothetical protein